MNNLQLIVEWDKYGFPKKPSDYRKLIDLAGMEGIGGVGLSNDEIVACDELYEYLERIYRSIMNSPPL